ncbi:MAG: aspartyl/asparaginyl beta-hydroxylase domain-containing protein, partial [Steroidobacteraceae bacterium]
MRLPKPFYRLPVRFDAARLAAEVEALPPEAWQEHPNRIPGNSSVRLVSVGGGENDDVNGPMQPTPHLARMPYVRQVLSSFGVVWSRSRLMRLAPGAEVPEHSDINHHWFYRVRVHIPVITRPEVAFWCERERVHMAAGEAWIFDAWRQHRVENGSGVARVHLVADTTGSATFWQFVAGSEAPGAQVVHVPFDPQRPTPLLFEQATPPRVMPPAEVDLLLLDLAAELAAQPGLADGELRLARYLGLLDAFRRDWRQYYLLHGDAVPDLTGYAQVRDALRASSREFGDGIMVRGNR